MDAKPSFRWAGRYYLFATAAALVGLALVAAGLQIGGIETYRELLAGDAVLTRSALVGLLPILLGLAVWRFGKAWALYATLTGATEAELAETYDNERVKSEILSVLDERLAEMQSDLRTVNRNVNKLRTEDDAGFEFDD